MMERLWGNSKNRGRDAVRFPVAILEPDRDGKSRIGTRSAGEREAVPLIFAGKASLPADPCGEAAEEVNSKFSVGEL